MSYERGADRSGKLVRERGFKGSSYGRAGPAHRLSDIDRDSQYTILALMARGVPLEQIACKTGVSLVVVRLVARYCRRGASCVP